MTVLPQLKQDLFNAAQTTLPQELDSPADRPPARESDAPLATGFHDRASVASSRRSVWRWLSRSRCSPSRSSVTATKL